MFGTISESHCSGGVHISLFHVNEEAAVIRIISALYKWGNPRSECISTCVRSQSVGMNVCLSDFQPYVLSYYLGAEIQTTSTFKILTLLLACLVDLFSVCIQFRNLGYTSFVVIDVDSFSSGKYV